MGAAQDRARAKNQLVTACSHRVRECPYPTREDLRRTDLQLSKSALFGPAIARLSFKYDGPHPNLDLFFLRQVLSFPDRSSSHHPSAVNARTVAYLPETVEADCQQPSAAHAAADILKGFQPTK